MTDEPLPLRVPEPEEILLGVVHQTPEQVANEEKVQAENREIRRLFLVKLLQDEPFRQWLRAKLEAWNTFGNPFGASPTGFPDPMATQFALGMKAAGWNLWEEFDEASPELASLMRREALKPLG